jgi:hypothetical protein
MDINVKTSDSKLKLGVQIIEQKIICNICKPKVVIEDKVYLETTTIMNQGVLHWMTFQRKSTENTRIANIWMDVN